MRKFYKAEDIDKVLNKMGKVSTEEMVFTRVWFKMEDRLTKRQKHLLNSFIWRPWGHPIRWVASAVCLFTILTSLLYHSVGRENDELASYLMNISNTPESVTRDPEIVRVSVLLSEPSSSSVDISVEDPADPLVSNEMFL